MKIAKPDLLAAINFVLPFVSRADVMPIIASIHLKMGATGLMLSATDLHAEAHSNVVPCIGSLDVCANAALFKGFCERAGEEVDLRHADGRMTLMSGKVKAVLKTLPGTDFPSAKPVDGVQATIVGVDLSRMIADVAHASARNDVRYQLNGIAIQSTGDMFHVVATNGYTFAGHSVKHDSKAGQCILPIDIAERLPKIVMADILERGIVFHCEGGTIWSSVIDAAYPDWQRIIVKFPMKISCNTDEFRAAIDATRPFQLESKGALKGKIMRIECDGATMRLTGGENGDELTASLDADGDKCDSSFNAKYWQDAMKHDLPDEMTIQFNDKGQFCVQHESWTGIIMQATV